MRFINFAIVRFSFCLILGIACAKTFHYISYFNFLVPVFGLMVIAWIIARKQVFQQFFFGIITYSCFFALGAVNYQIRLPNSQSRHYAHSYSEVKGIIQLKVSQNLKADTYNHKYIAQILSLDSTKVVGKVLVLVEKDTLAIIPEIDDILLLRAELKAIPKPLNPHQFDYAAYMEDQDVYGQLRVAAGDILRNDIGKATLRGRSNRLRDLLIDKLKQTYIQDSQRAIMQALLLGQRHEIDKELYRDYAAAGAVHILAVSGLHVGIIYFLLQFLLKPLRLFRKGRKIQIIILIAILWSFAFITGLSPSVTRAVAMFSFFGIAKLLNRPTNSINTLFLSLFFLLMLQPKWLFHVGFQLSYLAVFFILWVQPKISKIYSPRFYVDRLLWDIITVSFAAQLGVTPLSLYYFHQFPGLFFLSNIVILPFLGLVVGSGILILLLAAFNSVPEWLGLSYDFMLKNLNEFISWVAVREGFLIEDIHFNEFHLLGAYSLIIAIALLLRKSSYKSLVSVLCSLAFFLGLMILNGKFQSEHKLVIFQKDRETLIAIQNSESLLVYKGDTLSEYKNSYPVKSYRIAVNARVYSEKLLPNIFAFKDQLVLVIDSAAVYPKIDKIDIVLLRSSPKLNLSRLIDSLKPKIIVADGSNYRSYGKKWAQTCALKKLPFHYTVEGGAFILE